MPDVRAGPAKISPQDAAQSVRLSPWAVRLSCLRGYLRAVDVGRVPWVLAQVSRIPVAKLRPPRGFGGSIVFLPSMMTRRRSLRAEETHGSTGDSI